MHERSLVKTLIEQIIEEMQTHHLVRVHEVRLEIGEFSGVEANLVESAFAEMAPEYWDDAIRLVIEVVPLTALCLACDTTCRIEQFRFLCSQCGSRDLRITSGEEIRLVSLRADRRQATTSVASGA